MDLPFDCKCPASRTKDPSNIACAQGNVDAFTAWPELKFAFKNLSFAFAVLATLGKVTIVVFPCSVAIALWGVARLPERSSLLATLDPRLAPNSWVYWNKLLDLRARPCVHCGQPPATSWL